MKEYDTYEATQRLYHNLVKRIVATQRVGTALTEAEMFVLEQAAKSVAEARQAFREARLRQSQAIRVHTCPACHQEVDREGSCGCGSL